jgi:post-segregation antitoxin (ccd killing protein)
LPKVNVYLPDPLAAAARAAGLPISEVCQRALTAAVGSAAPRSAAGNDQRQKEWNMQSPEERAADLERAAEALRFALDPDPVVPARLKPIGAAHAVNLLRSAHPAIREWEDRAQDVAANAASLAVLEELGAPAPVISLAHQQLGLAQAALAAVELPDHLGDPSAVIDLLAGLRERSHPVPAR